MRRIIVAGASGFFGRAIVEALHADGLAPLRGSRRAVADVVMDVEDADSISRTVRRGDVVIDAVGPYQQRTTRLVQVATEIGFDVLDLADNLRYVAGVYQLQEQVRASGIRVFTGCSGISAISACAVRLSGLVEPIRVTGFLVPATRDTAVPGTAASLFASVGRPIQVLEGGSLRTRMGWRTRRAIFMPPPVGTRRGYLFESADAITLPAVWPGLKTVEFFVDTNVRGLNLVFCLAARVALVQKILEALQRPGLQLSRWLGRSAGGLGYEIEGADGRVVRLALTAAKRGFLTAIAPTVLVAKRLAQDRSEQNERAEPCGVILPDQHVDPAELLTFLQSKGVCYSTQDASGHFNAVEADWVEADWKDWKRLER